VNPFQYTARESDSETGLYYYRAGYYDSTIGRFISEDPLSFAGGNFLYQFVLNNPVRFGDPYGFSPSNRSCPDKCPVIPFHPGDANIDTNIKQARSNRPLLYNLLGAPLALHCFYQQVQNHGPWDYKHRLW